MTQLETIGTLALLARKAAKTADHYEGAAGSQQCRDARREKSATAVAFERAAAAYEQQQT